VGQDRPVPNHADTNRKILVIDNYDSFVYNIVQYLGQLGAVCTVVRNDEVTVAKALEFDGVLISPGPGTPEDAGISVELVKFCAENSCNSQVVSSFESDLIKNGSLFIIPNDRHLVNVIEQAKLQNLVLGLDYGIISYNDTSLKKVVENGITTISTDFNEMGKILAHMINTNSKLSVKNNSKLIMRNSI
jgi:hypothetical protein